jgi:hypothetical protein
MPEIERATMHSVAVEKSKLLETLLANRDKHVADLEEAMSGWRLKAIGALRRRADKLADGEDVDLEFKLPKPENHVEDYDRAIANLEWSIHDTVELSQQDFDQFVRDRWSWSQRFSTLSATYNNARG